MTKNDLKMHQNSNKNQCLFHHHFIRHFDSKMLPKWDQQSMNNYEQIMNNDEQILKSVKNYEKK